LGDKKRWDLDDDNISSLYPNTPPNFERSLKGDLDVLGIVKGKGNKKEKKL